MPSAWRSSPENRDISRRGIPDLNRAEMASSGSLKSDQAGPGSAPGAVKMRVWRSRSQPGMGDCAASISSGVMPAKKLYLALCSRTWSRQSQRQLPGPSKSPGVSGARYSPGSRQPRTAQGFAAPSTRPCIFDCFVAMERPYIEAMTDIEQGPVAAEMRRRLEAALHPTVLALRDDSEQHRGHGGYNPAGESHFSLTIESAAFIGKSRVERQRLVHAALGDLLHERVHALSITAREPQT